MRAPALKPAQCLERVRRRRRRVHRTRTVADPVRAFGSAAKAEALRTGPDAFLRNEANFPGAGAAELRARKPVTHAAADHFRRNLQGHRSHADVGTGRVFDNRQPTAAGFASRNAAFVK